MKGMDVSLAIANGRPFEPCSKIEFAFVDGGQTDVRKKRTN